MIVASLATAAAAWMEDWTCHRQNPLDRPGFMEERRERREQRWLGWRQAADGNGGSRSASTVWRRYRWSCDV